MANLSLRTAAGDTTVPNYGGGRSNQLDCWKALDRFLILGTEGGTYYVSEQKLTEDAARQVKLCAAQDPERLVRRLVEISTAGRAAKNDYALWVLAYVFARVPRIPSEVLYDALVATARIATHLFQFIEYAQSMRGWGKRLKTAVARWYTTKTPDQLAYQLIKYRNRNNWTHRDALRVSHPRFEDDRLNALARWAVHEHNKGEDTTGHPLISAFERVQKASEDESIALIAQYRLPWEALPTTLHKSPEVWKALVEHMPYEALTRNLGRLGSLGLLDKESPSLERVLTTLANTSLLERARMHPIKLLTAKLVYEYGHGIRGELSWKPNPLVTSALESAFYASFGFVKPTNKRLFTTIDISGSMSTGAVGGVIGLTPNVAAAALAMVTARREKNQRIYGFARELIPLGITQNDTLRSAMVKCQGAFGATDCTAPIRYALDRKIPVDAFLIYTDNETNVNARSVPSVLADYRRAMGIKTKLVVVAMTATRFTISDPLDQDSLDVVGFDTATPEIISTFITDM